MRRVFLPDSFFAIDGLIDTFLTILNQMEVYPAVIDQENQRYGPFLATTTVLMEAVKAGAGREEAHEAIKEHAVQTVRDLRSGEITTNNLVERLASDSRLGLSLEQLTEMMSRAQAMPASQPLRSISSARPSAKRPIIFPPLVVTAWRNSLRIAFRKHPHTHIKHSNFNIQ